MIYGIYLIYAVILLLFITSAAFIVFHLVRYSFDWKVEVFTLILFLAVFGVLLVSNIILFFSLPLNDILNF